MKICLIPLLLLNLSHPLHAQRPLLPDSLYPPKFFHYIPTSFSNMFSLNVTPILHIHSGDTVLTETIDALGRDKNGVKRQRGGNPLTGPFYIEGCKAGDVLKINLVKTSLNRPYAYTTESFVSRSMPDSITKQFRKPHLVKWNLDIANGYARLDSSFSPMDDLTNLRVPLKPFLGCIGVAPANKRNEILPFFQGEFGGNLDFSSIAELATVYLPIFHDGGFFYLGDGHAVQGDGEIAGNALETSLNVEFVVTIINKDSLHLRFPRVEDPIYIMTMGIDKSLDGAIKGAGAEMYEWLKKDYHLTLQEATQLMSTSIEYTIAEIADPKVEVVAKIKKETLKGLGRSSAKTANRKVGF